MPHLEEKEQQKKKVNLARSDITYSKMQSIYSLLQLLLHSRSLSQHSSAGGGVKPRTRWQFIARPPTQTNNHSCLHWHLWTIQSSQLAPHVLFWIVGRSRRTCKEFIRTAGSRSAAPKADGRALTATLLWQGDSAPVQLTRFSHMHRQGVSPLARTQLGWIAEWVYMLGNNRCCVTVSILAPARLRFQVAARTKIWRPSLAELNLHHNAYLVFQVVNSPNLWP